jgi:hypothetical protein
MQHTIILKISLLGLVAMLAGCQSYREQPTEKVAAFIITPTPVAKEIVAAPAGYSKCFRVEESFYQDMWVPAHHICQYENIHNKVIMLWISGYWACTKYNKEKGGACYSWKWKPAHLVHFSNLLSSEANIKLYYY